MHEFADERINDPVVGLSPCFARRDELHTTQERELMAHDRHRKVERLRQITDAQLVVREGMHDSDANRACQCLENIDCFDDDIVGRNAAPCCGHLCGVDDDGECGCVHFHS